MKLSGCKLFLVRVPLLNPYILSFTTVTHIDSIVVEIFTEDGGVGLAEAVPLPGYSSETRESIVSDLKATLPNLPGCETDEIEPYLANRLSRSPFSVSAVLTAKEFACNEFRFPYHLNIPLVAPISSEANPKTLVRKAQGFYDHGYRTIKLKVGRDVEQDKICMTWLLDWLPEDLKIRIDANQGYSLEQASNFLNVLKHKKRSSVECLEQPFGREAWDEFRIFSKNCNHIVPLMLDESIVKENDIEKAADYGADMIKLKLFKHHGLKGLLSLASKAKEMGLKIIFGNGVASDIGNIAEAVAFQQSDFFFGAFEGNGFCKLSQSILQSPLKEIGGNLRWDNIGEGRKLMKLKSCERLYVLMETGVI